ncbi:4-hydroxy-tetrahydrodipicolinate synthase [bacterium]|nr:4-hydroxy-tetrahydrodipicolinate synthase [bacterium]
MLKGSIVALVTPMKNNQVDKDAYRNLIEFQIQNGTSGILTCGCTGEPATLSHQEHRDLIDYTVEVVDKRVHVMAGTGSNNTKEAIELSQYAEKAGADSVLLITPYYNKPTQKGLYLHYKEIACNISIPIVLYNVPSRTGVSISPETVYELSLIKNIVGIKEASGSLDQVSQISSLCSNDFLIFSGDDSLTLPIMSVGGVGVISVAANIVPANVSKMVGLALENNWAEARKLHLTLMPIFKMLFIETNPIPVKAALSIMNMLEMEWRLPLTAPSAENLIKIEKTLRQSKVVL